MRIATGGMFHETNTFAAGRTGAAEFASAPFPLVRGEDVETEQDWMRETSAGGIIDTLRAEGVEVIPTVFARTFPSGLVESGFYFQLKREFIELIRAALPLDGICLALHGSMCVEGVDDPEGDLLGALRNLVGPQVPIVCPLDMHATVTEAMVRAANGLVAYRTAPHVDKYETGQKAAWILLKSLRSGALPVMERIRLPMLLGGEQSETAVAPMRDLIAAAEGMEREDGIFDASYMLGFPWADSPHGGVSVVVTGEAKARERVREAARTLARKFWNHRKDFTFTTEAYRPDEALDEALAHPGNPVVIADSGDNCTAGAAQDMTLMLQRILAKRITKALVVGVVDPRALQACTARGEGAVLDLDLGRVEPVPDGVPLKIRAQVVKLGAAKGIKSAVLGVDGVTVVVSEKRSTVTAYDPTCLADLGLTAGNYQIIVVKSGYLSPAYQKVAVRKMLALTPGDTNQILTELPYKRVPRPIFPLDEETAWPL